MSMNFAIKDIVHHRLESKSILRSNITILSLFFFYLNIVRSFNFLMMPPLINFLNFTLFELFTQFNQFLLILTGILAAAILIINNHAIIEARKKDIAIMKAIGTYPSHLYGFYLSEVLIICAISMIIAWILAFGGYLILYLVFASLISNLAWYPERGLSFLFMASLLMVIFLFNGWEIRKIGNLSYSETKAGPMKSKIHAILKPRLRNFLRRKSLSFNTAIRNLYRKKNKVRQTLVMITLASMILFTCFFGIFVINKTGSTYITQAQGEYVLALGNDYVLESYNQGYSSFSNSSADPLSTGMHLNSEYNITAFNPFLMEALNEYDIQTVDSRLFTTETIIEQPGVVLQALINETTGSEYQEYALVGGEDTRLVAMQGVHFDEILQEWYYEGALLNIQNGAVIGDTLAGEIYESALVQWISYSNIAANRTYRHKINAVVFDTFNRGNSAYFLLESLQETLGRPNFTNIILVDYSAIMMEDSPVSKEQFIEDISTLLRSQMGEDFNVLDLYPTFQANEQAIFENTLTQLILSMFMTFIIGFNLYQFQRGRVNDDLKDNSILYVLGAKEKFIQQTIFWELFFLTVGGIVLGFIGSMYLILIFLMDNSINPSIWVPLGTGAGILVFFTGLSWIIA
ncbi:MAG: FtsX-like permease family protein, partial [Promethearchaeota archaeon]